MDCRNSMIYQYRILVAMKSPILFRIGKKAFYRKHMWISQNYWLHSSTSFNFRRIQIATKSRKVLWKVDFSTYFQACFMNRNSEWNPGFYMIYWIFTFCQQETNKMTSYQINREIGMKTKISYSSYCTRKIIFHHY